MTGVHAPLADRLAHHVEDRGYETLCWVWSKYVSRKGYGLVRADNGGKAMLAHRAAYEVYVGPVPDGYDLHHRCEQRDCVNPAHLEPVTTAEHAQQHLKTHCLHGHEFTPENTYIRRDGRHCRACNRIAARAYQKRLAERAAA